MPRLKFKLPFTADMRLDDAQDELRKLIDDGHECPCCTQFAKVYTRKLNAGMARSLIVMYRAARLDWQHIPTTVGGRSREEGKLRYWGLVEEETTLHRPDGGRAGYWRVTATGEEFVKLTLAMPSHAKVYDGRCLGLIGDPVSIRQALGSAFDYEELMSA